MNLLDSLSERFKIFVRKEPKEVLFDSILRKGFFLLVLISLFVPFATVADLGLESHVVNGANVVSNSENLSAYIPYFISCWLGFRLSVIKATSAVQAFRHSILGFISTLIAIAGWFLGIIAGGGESAIIHTHIGSSLLACGLAGFFFIYTAQTISALLQLAQRLIHKVKKFSKTPQANEISERVETFPYDKMVVILRRLKLINIALSVSIFFIPFVILIILRIIKGYTITAEGSLSIFIGIFLQQCCGEGRYIAMFTLLAFAIIFTFTIYVRITQRKYLCSLRQILIIILLPYISTMNALGWVYSNTPLKDLLHFFTICNLTITIAATLVLFFLPYCYNLKNILISKICLQVALTVGFLTNLLFPIMPLG